MRQEAEQQRSQQQRDQQQQGHQQADQQWNDPARQQQSRANGDMAGSAATRRSLEQRPRSCPSATRSSGAGTRTVRRNVAAVRPACRPLAKMAAELIGGMTAGMCDSMLGHGTIEFRPAGVFAIGRDAASD